MKRSETKLTLILFAFVVILGLSAWAVSAGQISQEPVAQNQPVDHTIAGRTEITYGARAGITSLEQLRSEAKNVITTESEYGQLVDSIEGHRNGTDGKYWSFYVNGEMAQVGADAYTQKEGDLVEWKFQKL